MSPFSELIYPDLSYEITGALFKVQNNLGRFCNEKQYADAIEQELKVRKIKYEREKILPPSFEAETQGRNRIDFVIEDKIILEIKAKKNLGCLLIFVPSTLSLKGFSIHWLRILAISIISID
jgi:GxxExxY protein